MKTRMGTMLALVASLLGCGSGPLWEKSASNTKVALRALYGFGDDDIWAAGENGVVLHYDGSAWTNVTTGTTKTFNAIWGSGPSDVWFVGDSGAVLRWNGSSLQPVTGAPTGDLSAVRGLSANAVFFCGFWHTYVFDGAFRELRPNAKSLSCNNLFALGAGEVGVEGSPEGELVDSLLGLATDGTSRTIAASVGTWPVLGVTPTDVWLFERELTAPTTVTRVGSNGLPELSLPKYMTVTSAWARGPADVWMGGYNGMLAHYDGKQVSLVASDEFQGPIIRALWGSATTTWAAGESGWILRRPER